MKLTFIDEPELEFGADRHIDIRFGLMNYGPVDIKSTIAPREIRAGIVGIEDEVESLWSWLERCRDEIPAKPSRQPNLFPRFPGFRPETGFCSTLIMDSQLTRTFPRSVVEELVKNEDVNQAVKDAVELFQSECQYLAEKTSANVIICAKPEPLIDVTEGVDPDHLDEQDRHDSDASDSASKIDFHDLLKARSLSFKVPLQVITPPTYDETKLRRQKRQSIRPRKSQDEATRAWNLHTALYYKAKGVPWRLVRDPLDYVTCYVGVSFYQALDRSSLLTSVAQIFNERGEGVIVRGGLAKVSKTDLQPHLSGDDAFKLLRDALLRYKTEHGNFPARMVVHKSSTCTPDENEGFLRAAKSVQIEWVDVLAIGDCGTRLYRLGTYPPLRGTLLSMEDRFHILYSRGSVDFFRVYPGMYIPTPLHITCEHVTKSPKYLAQEILALSKMNWNSTQFDGREPVTLSAARKVGAILKYVEKDDVATHYRFYM